MRTAFAYTALTLLAGTSLATACFSHLEDDCIEESCHIIGGGNGQGADGGNGAQGGGAGGAGNGGGGAGGDTQCMGHTDCTTAAASQCDDGACVPCTDSTQCAHIADAGICDNGTCVECALQDESACTGGDTCDLIAKQCVSVAAGSIELCYGCTNDVQCEIGRCIPTEFQSVPQGYHCLEEVAAGCDQPFVTSVTRASISGEAAADYCGLDETVATCSALVALVEDWRCSGDDGMCSPDGVRPEQVVPGAICEQVGTFMDRCTYACTGDQQCPMGAAFECGDGDGTPPGWCGGT